MHKNLFQPKKNAITMNQRLKLENKQKGHAAAALEFWLVDLLLRPQTGVVSISWCGTSRLSLLVIFLKLWTFNLAISASSSGVISLTTTVSLHSGLCFTPDLPLPCKETLFKKFPFPTNASAVRNRNQQRETRWHKTT